jgi:CRP-like cAMP-binding protein
VAALKSLGPHHRALLVDALTGAEFKAGQAVFRKGEPGDAFYIVREGTAVVRDGGTAGKELARLGPGQYFGERALLGAEVRRAPDPARCSLSTATCLPVHYISLCT